MEKNTLDKLVEAGYSTHKIAELLNTSQTNVRYWLNKFGSTTVKAKVARTEKTCPKCSQTKLVSEFYLRKDGRPYAYCKECNNSDTVIRQRQLKLEAVNYKGGECQLCGYSKYIGALEFHHLEPSEKDFNLAAQKCTSMNDVIKAELDKCALLCANCHRETHGGVN